MRKSSRVPDVEGDAAGAGDGRQQWRRGGHRAALRRAVGRGGLGAVILEVDDASRGRRRSGGLRGGGGGGVAGGGEVLVAVEAGAGGQQVAIEGDGLRRAIGRAGDEVDARMRRLAGLGAEGEEVDQWVEAEPGEFRVAGGIPGGVEQAVGREALHPANLDEMGERVDALGAEARHLRGVEGRVECRMG
ncbi:hypothetical protein [Belnapia moabensis]|uniref:hypothetical protein n=1 Tax=Belnapia moabensis TaxID=365533 RepID=UPI001FE09C6F|nr:hypothetical protein [Belnapia moabensis]